MSISIRMSDGVKDSWGAKYMKSVYNDRAMFRQAISQLTQAIDTLEDYQSRLTPIPGRIQELWDDYWGTERLIKGVEKLEEEYKKAIEELTIARDNLDILVRAAEYYKSKNWGKKSDAKAADDILKGIFTLGAAGDFDTEKDVNFNC